MAEAVGSIAVEVVPDATGFVKKLQATLLPAASKMGEEFGRTLGDTAAKRIKSALTDVFKNPGDTTTPATKKGEEYGGAFARALKAKLEQAIRSLPDIKLNADSSDADRAIAGIREELKSLQDRRIGIDVSEEEALAKLRELQSQLDRIGSESVTAEVKMNTASASAALKDFQGQLDKLAASKTEAKVDAEWQGGFEQKLKAKLESALANLPKAELDADSTPADRAIERVRTEIENLHGQRIGIDVTADAAMAKLIELQAELERLGAESPNVQVKTDVLSASAELAAFQAEVSRISHEHPTVKVDADTAGAQAQLLALRGAATSGVGGVSLLTLAIAGLGPALIPIAAVGVGVFGAIAGAAVAAAAGVGVLVLALGPVIAAVQAVTKAHDKSGAAAASAAKNTNQLANAQDGLKSALKGVQTAEQDASEARIRSAESTASAQRSLQETVRTAARDQVESERQIADAEQSLADARAAAAQDQEQSARRISDAQRNLQDAVQQGADRITQADRSVADAERSLADTQRSVLVAQQNLNQAREQAVKDAQDLAARLADSQLDERGAILEVKDAQTELDKLRARGATSQDEAFQKAQLNYDRSVQRLKEIQTQNGRLTDEKAASDKAGVDGSKGVQSAQQQLVDAQQRQIDAAQKLADAQKGADQARIASARQVSDAQRALADAVDASAQRQEADQRRIVQAQQAVTDAIDASAEKQRQDQLKIADAQRAVTDAQRSAAEQARHSADSIASAQQAVIQAHRAVADAAKASGAAAGGAADDAAKKLAKLSPAGREFVKFVTDELQPAFKGLSNAAQEGFLPGLQRGIHDVLPQLSGLKDFITSLGTTMGSLAEDAGKGLSSPVWKAFFDYIAKIAGPTIEALGKSFGNIATGFAGLIPLFEPVRKVLFDGLLDLSKKFADFGKTAGSNPQFQAFMSYIKENGPKVFKTLGDIVGAALSIVTAMAPVGPVVLAVVDAVAGFIKKIPPDVIRALVLGFVALALAFKAVGLTAGLITGVSTAVEAFGLALDFLAANPIILTITLIVLAIVAIGVAVVEAYKHWKPFRDAVNAAWDGIKAAATAAWENVIKPTFLAIKNFIFNDLIPAFLWLWHNVIVPVWDGIKLQIQAAWLIIQAIFKVIKAFVEDILAPVFTWLWNNIIKPVWSGISVAIQLAWSVIQVLFKAAILFIQAVLAPVFTWLWHTIIQPVWSGISVAIQLAWSVIQVLFKAAILFIQAVLAPVFTWLWNTIIKPVWNGISTTISTVWNTLIKPVLTTVGNFIKDTVAPAFERGVAAIKTAWDKVSEVAKVPVKFIVNTVINDGIIGTWNKIAGWFGVAPVGRVQLPSGFASGGLLKGPGNGTSDSIPIRVSNGEYIVRAKAVKQLGPDFMNIVNQADKYQLSGDPSALGVRKKFATGGLVDHLPGFATGGAVDPAITSRVAAVKAWLPSVARLPYVWGAVGPGGYDCSGIVGEVWARLTGRASYRRYMTTNTILDAAGSLGLSPGPGMFTIGVSREHTDGNLNGLGFEAPHTGVNVRVGGGAQATSNFPSQFHLTSLGTAGAGTGGGAATPVVPPAPAGIDITDPIGSLHRLLTAPLKDMSGAGKGPFADLVKKLPGKVVGGAMSKVGSVLKNIATAPFSGLQAAVSLIGGGAESLINKAKGFLGFANGGLVKYDQGGLLPTGASNVINNTGKPEAILTSTQWNSLTGALKGDQNGSADLLAGIVQLGSRVEQLQAVLKVMISAINSLTEKIQSIPTSGSGAESDKASTTTDSAAKASSKASASQSAGSIAANVAANRTAAEAARAQTATVAKNRLLSTLQPTITALTQATGQDTNKASKSVLGGAAGALKSVLAKSGASGPALKAAIASARTITTQAILQLTKDASTNALPKALAMSVIDRLRSTITSLGSGGLISYDSGGWLPQGVSSVINNTGRPEPVLSASQWDSLRHDSNGGGSVTIQNLTIDAPAAWKNLDAMSSTDKMLFARDLTELVNTASRSHK